MTTQTTITPKNEPEAFGRQARTTLQTVPSPKIEAPKPLPVPPPVTKRSKRSGAAKRAAGFAFAVGIPTALTAGYLWGYAQDRYVTNFSFSVRAQQQDPMAGGMGAMAAMGMGGGASDAGVVADFMANREILERMVDRGVDVSAIMSIGHDKDPVFSLKPNAPIEEVEEFWKKTAHVERDPQTGIVRVSVKAADREASLLLAKAAMAEADSLVNDLSERAVQDATRVAAAEAERAGDRAQDARFALQQFRSANAIVDPVVELEARMGVVAGLRQKLSDALIQRSGVVGNSGSGETDIRVRSLDVQIASLREAIAEEERLVGADDGYALVASEFERLAADLEFSEETWRAAIARQDAASQEADSRRAYLAVHAEPRMAEISVVPNRWLSLMTVFGSLALAWVLCSLILSGMKDRR